MRLDYKVSYRNKDGSIQCIVAYKDGDKWRQRSKQGFKTQKESKPWQDEVLKEIKEQLENAVKINPEYSKVTFKEFKEIYLRELSLYREPNTVVAHRSSLRRFSDLNDQPITDIKYFDIRNIVNKMIKEGLKISTMELYVSRLRIFFDYAVSEYNIISKNPLKENSIKLPKEKSRNEIRTLTHSEVNNLINDIKPAKDRMIVIIAVKCGLRAGEIAGLTWDDVDFANKDLIINKQWKELRSGHHGFGSPKSKNSYRKVPIPLEIIRDLEEYKDNSVRELRHNRLFMERITANMCTRLNQKFKRMDYDISLHDLRHTYATNLIALGIDFKTISEYLGDTVEVVIKTYAHFNKDMYEAGRAKINNL